MNAAKDEEIADLVRRLVLARQPADDKAPLPVEVPRSVVREALRPETDLAKRSNELISDVMTRLRTRAQQPSYRGRRAAGATA